jgi:hypothetical protein
MKFTPASVIFAGLFAITCSAHADNILVPNFSFESGSAGNGGGDSVVIDDWVESGASYYGNNQSNASEFNNTGTTANPAYGAFDGAQYAFFNVAPGTSMTFTTAAPIVTSIAAGTTYTLSVALGNHNEDDSSNYGQPGNESFSLLADNIVIPGATFTLPNGTLGEGVTGDYSLTFTTTGANSIFVGQNLSIQLASNPNGVLNADGSAADIQSSFDNVQLSATAVPEPATWAMIFAGGLVFATMGFRRCRA